MAKNSSYQRKEDFNSELDVMTVGELDHFLQNPAAFEDLYQELYPHEDVRRSQLKKLIKSKKKKAAKRQEQMADMSFLKEIEEGLASREDLRIEAMMDTQRRGIGQLLGDKSSLARVYRKRRLTAEEQHFSRKQVQEYIDHVRGKLEEQFQALDSVREETDREQQFDLLKRQFEQTMILLKGLTNHGKIDPADKAAIHSSFLREFIALKDADDISGVLGRLEELYEDLEGILAAKSTEKRNRLHQQSMDRYLEDARPQLREILLRLSEEILEDEPLSSTEVEELLTMGSYQGYRETYAGKIATHLTQLEYSLLSNALIEYEKEQFNREISYDFDTQIGLEKAELQEIFQSFRKQRYSLERAISEVSETVISPDERSDLLRLNHILVDQVGEDREALRQEIISLETVEDVRVFQERGMKRLRAHFLKENQEHLDESDLDRLEKNNPLFDLMELSTEQAKYRLRETEEQESYQLQGLIEDYEDIIDERETPSNRNQALRDLEKKIEEQMASDPVFPPVLRLRYESLLRKRANLDQYGRSTEKLLQIKNLDNPNQLKQALETLFCDFRRIEDVNSLEVKKLSKVMTLDHPMTAIRFSCANKKPMKYGDQILVHKLGGAPATYQMRSKAVVEEAQKLLRNQDFEALRRLFDEGQMADRLYYDSLFFPGELLKDEARREELLYDTHRNPRTGEMIRQQINPGLHQHRKFFEQKMPDDERLQEMLEELPSRLVDDEGFMREFKHYPEELDYLGDYRDSLVFNDDGTIDREQTDLNIERIEAVTAAEVAATKSLDDMRIDEMRLSPERIKFLKETASPLIAQRSAQLGNELAGYVAGGLQHGLRVGKQTALYPARFGKLALSSYWKDLQFLSPMMVYVAIWEAVEHIGNLTDFNTQYGAYQVLSNVFKGTIWGSEFTKLMQQKEDERAGQFKEAFADFGHQQVIDKIYTARDVFELKGAMMEGFETRGIISMDHLLDQRFLKQLNRFTPTVIVPMKYTDEEMQMNDVIRSKMLNEHILKAVDDIWGQGTFLSWVNSGISAYQSKMDTAKKQAEGDSNPETVRKMEKLFETLKKPGGREELLALYHPAEILGLIDEDLDKGDMDSWMTYGLLQALVIERVITNDDFLRVQGAHANDRPMYSILEYQQSINSGMDKAWEACKASGKLDEFDPFFGFFQGHSNIELELAYVNGKFRVPKGNAEEFEKMRENGDLVKVSLNGSDLQADREFQPSHHRTMDNSCTALISQYPTTQIIDALREDTAGRIDIRPHDTCAKLRGFQYDICSRVDALRNCKDQMNFNRLSGMLYNDLIRLFAVVEHLAKYGDNGSGEKRKIVPTNADLSPMKFKREDTDNSRNNSGQSNFQTKILSVAGVHQRVGTQGNESLNAFLGGKGGKASAFLRDVKLMSGMQFITGVDLRTGIENGVKENYSKDWSPADHFPDALSSMIGYVEELAERNGLVCEIANPKYGLKAAPGQTLDGIDYEKIQSYIREFLK